MKRLSPKSTCTGASDKKIKISHSELQSLIKQEVCSAVKRNEANLQGFIEKIQHLDHGLDYESSIQKLEAQINTLTKTAEAALDYVTKKKEQDKIPRPSLTNNGIVRVDSENETASPSGSSVSIQLMEITKKAKKMHEDNEEFKAALTDLREMSPHVKSYATIVEKDPKDELQTEDNDGETAKPKVEEMNVERLSSGHSNIPKNTDLKQQKEKLSYPPLPPHAFPSSISVEAVSYNVPKRPEVYLALIRNPAGLSVLWKEEMEDPSAPPMDSYSILMTTETVKGSGVFPAWTTLGEVKAFALPMCVMIRKYKPGRKVCVAVVGKDTFGRYGPYSEVVTAALPE